MICQRAKNGETKMKSLRISMKNYKSEQNKFKYLTKISQIKQGSMHNYQTMGEYEDKEKDMVERLKTTIMQVSQIENKIRQFEKGKLPSPNKIGPYTEP
mmetsp:Transcript_23832/g.21171  ORF Transcript_23832/g.21171 Transcript_23832/m.21171 type:complete len:99 (+) Transcript_23832:254-550(+)